MLVKTQKHFKVTLLGISLIALGLTACSQAERTIDKSPVDKSIAETPQDTVKTDPVEMAGSAPADNTERTADYNPTRNAYFGETHVHTKNSFDAYIFNVRTTPDDVYRFAKGETVQHPSGYAIKLGGHPLDFAATTDHGAYMGILPAMDTKGHPLNDLEMSKDMFSQDPDTIVKAFSTIGGSVRSGKPFAEIYDREIIDRTWQSAINAADRHYEPGKLTTFSGYEYTAVSERETSGVSFAGGNLHRNVLFEDEAPKRLFSTLDSINPEDLWTWMDEQREAGRDSISIPHNSNVSDGDMFKMTSYAGDTLTPEQSAQRLRNEPLVEISQVKGTSETHPSLSPNDEYANFEIYEKLLSSYVTSKVTGSYIREALANGFELERQTGTNPYKFGVISASDSHVAGGAFDENDYWSKVGVIDGTAALRGSVPPNGEKAWDGVQRNKNAEEWFSQWGASGLAGVWAEENTRESIFAAMRRKETFATSGPRIQVRFFGGYDFDDSLLNAGDMVTQAYATGVPMGGTLQTSDSAPKFLAWAMRDPRNAPLDRMQIVKVWHDGAPQERIYDIACSDGRTPDPKTRRCADNGARVDLSDCSVSTNSGDPELRTLWQDPDFDAAQSAAYYVRVLENPTCRWSTWDALKSEAERNPDLQATLKERAWTSPIWYDGQP